MLVQAASLQLRGEEEEEEGEGEEERCTSGVAVGIEAGVELPLPSTQSRENAARRRVPGGEAARGSSRGSDDVGVLHGLSWRQWRA